MTAMNPPSTGPSLAQLQAFLAAEFPQTRVRVEALDEGVVTASLRVDASDLRPGGTVSGPTLMALADVALYAAVLAEVGLVALAVTTDLNVHFLRKPQAGMPLWAKARLLTAGRRLVVGEVAVHSGPLGQGPQVAQAVGTYALPSSSAAGVAS